MLMCRFQNDWHPGSSIGEQEVREQSVGTLKTYKCVCFILRLLQCFFVGDVLQVGAPLRRIYKEDFIKVRTLEFAQSSFFKPKWRISCSVLDMGPWDTMSNQLVKKKQLVTLWNDQQKLEDCSFSVQLHGSLSPWQHARADINESEVNNGIWMQRIHLWRWKHPWMWLPCLAARLAKTDGTWTGSPLPFPPVNASRPSCAPSSFHLIPFGKTGLWYMDVFLSRFIYFFCCTDGN